MLRSWTRTCLHNTTNNTHRLRESSATTTNRPSCNNVPIFVHHSNTYSGRCSLLCHSNNHRGADSINNALLEILRKYFIQRLFPLWRYSCLTYWHMWKKCKTPNRSLCLFFWLFLFSIYFLLVLFDARFLTVHRIRWWERKLIYGVVLLLHLLTCISIHSFILFLLQYISRRFCFTFMKYRQRTYCCTLNSICDASTTAASIPNETDSVRDNQLWINRQKTKNFGHANTLCLTHTRARWLGKWNRTRVESPIRCN